MSTTPHLSREKEFPFIPKHANLAAILTDHQLAALGDAYVNFVYSLNLSRKRGRPVGRKADSSTLASALKKADLRRLLPSRTDRHKQADAAEALIIYGWLVGAVSLEETLRIMEREGTAEEAFSLLLQRISERLNMVHGKV
ncbi:MAG: hypothetical protein NWF14_02800 [Candidatus Bathyarchaeota archaeon]|nr:hypothetical protein [Candidatus Bathyarchaeota archaeon]